ncbi:hypothetical protein L1049_008083 [Liquidambar formosana]|uniref:NAC domain-containing protein n=1 Tax=Liquidambar formosana TaxID=63359 RepID=A0AAP0S8W4_LIQFO
METKPNSNIQLLPGFRFHPSDEELIVHYLRNKATSSPVPASIIAEVDLYKCDPWELPKKALFGEDEWFFFTPRDRKYPNGARPNRATASGYWKATGTDKPILTSSGLKRIGVKKALVFYKGRPSKGVKTDWIMHEYRLLDTMIWNSKQKGSMRLDDWVLCRVWQRSSSNPRNNWEDRNGPSYEPAAYYSPKTDESCHSKNTDLNVEMVRNYLFNDCPLLPYIMASQDLPCIETASSISFQGSTIIEKTSVCENNLDTKNSQFSMSSYDSTLNPQKRKPIDEFLFQSFLPNRKKLSSRDCTEKEEVIVSVSNDETKTNFCGTNHSEGQSEGNSFLGDQWNSITQYQELNHLAFTEESD